MTSSGVGSRQTPPVVVTTTTGVQLPGISDVVLPAASASSETDDVLAAATDGIAWLSEARQRATEMEGVTDVDLMLDGDDAVWGEDREFEFGLRGGVPYFRQVDDGVTVREVSALEPDAAAAIWHLVATSRDLHTSNEGATERLVYHRYRRRTHWSRRDRTVELTSTSAHGAADARWFNDHHDGVKQVRSQATSIARSFARPVPGTDGGAVTRRERGIEVGRWAALIGATIAVVAMRSAVRVR